MYAESFKEYVQGTKQGSTSVKKETERVLRKKEMAGRDGERGKCKRGDWKPQVSLLIYQLCAWQPLGPKWMCTPQGSGTPLDNGDKQQESEGRKEGEVIQAESMKGWGGGVSVAIRRLTSGWQLVTCGLLAGMRTGYTFTDWTGVTGRLPTERHASQNKLTVYLKPLWTPTSSERSRSYRWESSVWGGAAWGCWVFSESGLCVPLITNKATT